MSTDSHEATSNSTRNSTNSSMSSSTPETVSLPADAPHGPQDSTATPPSAPAFLTREQIVAVDDGGYEDVHVPEWGGMVRVKALTAAERSKLESLMLRQNPDGSQRLDASQIRQLFCAFAIIDPKTNRRMFSDKEIAILGSKSAGATDRVYASASRQARVSEQDIREMQGNSPSDLSDDSSGGTDSE